MKQHLLRLILVATTCLLTGIAIAEGPLGSAGTDPYGGPYRRVRSNTGYRGIKCSYSVPTVVIPGDLSISKSSWDPNEVVMTHRSSPGFYVGIGGNGVEIDTGVTYEYLIKRQYLPNVPAGWSLFMRVSGGPLDTTGDGWWGNPPGGWRACSTENPYVTSFDLTCAVNTDRSVYLNTNAVGADMQPGLISTGNPAFNSTTGLYVKRVTQIAQHTDNPFTGCKRLGTYIEDGTIMTGCVASNVRLTTVPSPGTNDWDEWSSTSLVNQDHTGYSPGGSLPYQCMDMHITSTTNASDKLYIIDFPGRTTNSERNAISLSRYQNEAIDIRLRSARKVTGTTIIPKRR